MANRQVKIKSDAVNRLGKELRFYMKEQEGLQAKLAGLREGQADALTIKKTEEFVDETVSVVQDTHSRLVKSFNDLERYIAENNNDEGATDSAEFANAKSVVADMSSLVRT